MQMKRSRCAAVALDADRVLVAGGYDGDSELSTTEILSLGTMSFSRGPNLNIGGSSLAAIKLDEHRIMIFGGRNSKYERLKSTEILDISTMKFALGPSMISERWGCVAVPVSPQHVLIVGGEDDQEDYLVTTELLDVPMMEFEPGPTMATQRMFCAATRLDCDGRGESPRIIVIGGEDGNGTVLSTTEVLSLDEILPSAKRTTHH